MATKRDLLRMVRLFCCECMGGSRASEGKWPISEHIQDIKDCTAPECVWFPYRFGRDPEKRKMTKAQLESFEKVRLLRKSSSVN